MSYNTYSQPNIEFGNVFILQDFIKELSTLDLPSRIQNLEVELVEIGPPLRKDFDNLRNHLANKYASLKSLRFCGCEWKRELSTLGKGPSLLAMNVFNAGGVFEI